MATTTVRITKRAVDGMRADDTLWDAEVAGFCVRCRGGMAKSYGLKYREGRGRAARQRWFTIGRHGAPWTVETARIEAKRLLAHVAAGGTPMGEAQVARQAPNMNEMLDRWLAEHVEPKRKQRTAEGYRILLELARPKIGKLKVEAVTRANIASLHHDLRATPYNANRLLAVLSSAFGWAEKIGLRTEDTNPARKIERYREATRERFLSDEELVRLGEALREAEVGHRELMSFEAALQVWRRANQEGRDRAVYGATASRPRKPDIAVSASLYAVAAIRLLILTGARLSEIIDLRWEWVGINSGLISLPDSKTGKKTIELPLAAISLLLDIPRVEGNPHVIVGDREGAALVNLQKPWQRIRARAGLHDVRLHDLRHTFASKAIGAGYSLRVAGSLLGHTQAATTQRYAHVADTVRRRAAETIAADIAAAMGGAPTASVIKVKR